jgi:hypothetical protein
LVKVERGSTIERDVRVRCPHAVDLLADPERQDDASAFLHTSGVDHDELGAACGEVVVDADEMTIAPSPSAASLFFGTKQASCREPVLPR